MRECTEERFLKDVAQHELTIVRDDGVNRHLRFKQPGTYNMHFDLITWPGYLCYTGDMGTYVFKRMKDMFEFFRTEGLRINPGYWGEKLEAVDSCDGYRQWSSGKFEQRIREAFSEWLADGYLSAAEKEDAHAQFERDVIGVHAAGIETAYGAAMAFEFMDQWPFHDWWEVDTDEYSFRFIWCCYALAWGVQQYDEYQLIRGLGLQMVERS